MTRKPNVATFLFSIIIERKLRRPEFQEKRAIGEGSIPSIDFTMPTTLIFAKCDTGTRLPTPFNAGYGLTRRMASTILTASLTVGLTTPTTMFSLNSSLMRLFLLKSAIGRRWTKSKRILFDSNKAPIFRQPNANTVFPLRE